MQMFDEGVDVCLFFNTINLATHLVINLGICDFQQEDLTHQLVEFAHFLFHSTHLSMYPILLIDQLFHLLQTDRS
jgi:uncharacterized membrane protein